MSPLLPVPPLRRLPLLGRLSFPTDTHTPWVCNKCPKLHDNDLAHSRHVTGHDRNASLIQSSTDAASPQVLAQRKAYPCAKCPRFFDNVKMPHHHKSDHRSQEKPLRQ